MDSIEQQAQCLLLFPPGSQGTKKYVMLVEKNNDDSTNIQYHKWKLTHIWAGKAENLW